MKTHIHVQLHLLRTPFERTASANSKYEVSLPQYSATMLPHPPSQRKLPKHTNKHTDFKIRFHTIITDSYYWEMNLSF